MATIDLGRLGFVNKGTYNNSTTYEKNDLVQFTDGGLLSTYLYIDSTAQSGQAPSSSGTAGSRWVYFAKGVADSLASAGNNKVIVTNASGQVTPLSIGSAGQVLKTNSSANGFEFGADEGGKILQVVTTNKIDAFNTNSTSYVDITGLSATLTPSATTSKVLVQVSLGSFQSSGANNRAYCRLKQAISGGATTYPFLPNDATGHESIVTTCFRGNSGDWQQMPVSFMKLTGALNTTSAVTFTVQAESDGTYAQLNKSYNTDGNTGNCHSSITLFEIAG